MTVIGIAFSQNYSVERDVRMKIDDSIDIQRYHFVFEGVRNIVGPNWTSGEGVRGGHPEAAPYVALGEELNDGSWAVRLYYKPFVRWIWYGRVLMALGGLYCMLDPRYRIRKILQEAQ